MKVAIIGAGVSGLSCAHELERYGISPVIYELENFIGDKEAHISAILSIADRPIKDALAYFHDVCHLDMTPHNIIKRLTHYSPNKKVVIEGDHFGYFFKRGKHFDSIKCQLSGKLKKSIIKFNQNPDYAVLSKEYDYVVVATGNPAVSKLLGCWQDTISGWIKGAVLEGDFDIHELIIWLNKKYCKNGYAYLCPYDCKRASVALFVPFATKEQLEHYWKIFLETEHIRYTFVEEFAIEHFSGFVNSHKVNNIYLIGASGGAVSPFLGFGQLNSVTMGVLAAKSIVEGLDYDTLIKDVINKEKSFYEIRKAFNTLTNNGYDKLVSLIGFPGIKHFIYDTNFNVVKYSAKTLRLIKKVFQK